MFLLNTGELMKKRRKELGMNADYIADKLGVSRSTIFRYENGEIEKMPISVLKPLSEILGTTPAYLMGWEDETNFHNPKNTFFLTEEEKELITQIRDFDEPIRDDLLSYIADLHQDRDKIPKSEQHICKRKAN